MAFFVSIVLLLLYLAWGVYTLRLRYQFHEELSISLEALTLGGVVLFYVFELFLFDAWMGHLPVLFVFGMLGLFVSGTALYGPMAISVASQLLVDMVTLTEETGVHVPCYTPAEALEKQGDYEGALQEYRVILRIFPRDTTATIRIAHNLARLDHNEEAAQWFEKGLSLVNDADTSLRLTNRLASIYSKELDRPADAVRVLEDFLERFPDAEYAESVRQRVERIARERSVSDSQEVG